MRDTELLRKTLEKDIPVLRALILDTYSKLDRRFGLKGAKVPVVFGFDTDRLGAYTRRSSSSDEHFYFSLLFVGYGVKHPLSKEDRMDLFLHEYAHYMQYNMEIPKKYQWQPGIHGSAWKYCCSLVGAAPTPFYKAGEALMDHDYEKALKNPIHDKTIPVVDRYRQEQKYRQEQNSIVHYKVGEAVNHPKFGEGIVEGVEPRTGSVRLQIRFGSELKAIDQKWLKRSTYQSGHRNKG